MNATDISLMQYDVVFGKRGRKSLDGNHITGGTKRLWRILQTYYEAHRNADKYEKRNIEKAIMEQIKKELPDAARFLRFVPAKGSDHEFYRLIADDEVRKALRSIYSSWYYRDRKQHEKKLTLNDSKNNAASMIFLQQPFAATKSENSLQPGIVHAAATKETFTTTNAKRPTDTTNEASFHKFARVSLPEYPLLDPSGITILSITLEEEEVDAPRARFQNCKGDFCTTIDPFPPAKNAELQDQLLEQQGTHHGGKEEEE